MEGAEELGDAEATAVVPDNGVWMGEQALLDNVVSSAKDEKEPV